MKAIKESFISIYTILRVQMMKKNQQKSCTPEAKEVRRTKKLDWREKRAETAAREKGEETALSSPSKPQIFSLNPLSSPSQLSKSRTK